VCDLILAARDSASRPLEIPNVTRLHTTSPQKPCIFAEYRTSVSGLPDSGGGMRFAVGRFEFVTLPPFLA